MQHTLKKLLFLLLSTLCMQSASAMTTHPSSEHTKRGFIAYTDVGRGKALVLIHAFPTDQRLWTTQLEGLKPYFRVITLDLWGFGHSAATDGQTETMDNYAEEVKDLLDQLHIQKAIIGGESMGGYVSLAFAKQYPERVAGLVLSDTQSIADSPEAKAKREAAAIDVLAHGSSQLIHDFMPKALSPDASESTRTFLQTMAQEQAPTAIASALRGMALRQDTSNILSQTAIPVLIITGKQDALISPQQSDNMHALAKNSKLVVIPAAGHLSNLEQPKQWNKAVMDMFYQTAN